MFALLRQLEQTRMANETKKIRNQCRRKQRKGQAVNIDRLGLGLSRRQTPWHVVVHDEEAKLEVDALGSRLGGDHNRFRHRNSP